MRRPLIASKQHGVYAFFVYITEQIKTNTMAKTTIPMTKAATNISLLNEANSVLTNFHTYPGMNIYELKWKILDMLCRQYPANTTLEEVYLKADTLNRYYSTNIFSILSMAKGIIHIPDIDQRLQNGDPTLVKDNTKPNNDIATIISGHTNYSFATKYCACHNPAAYHIYDNIVADFFVAAIKSKHLTCPAIIGLPISKNQMKNDYAFYKDIYTAFMQQYNLTSLTYREVDWYIWTAGKLLKGLLPVPYKNKSSVNVWTAGKSLMPQLPQFKQLFQLV